MQSYPYLSDIIFALTGIHVPLPFATFGLLVGIAALVAAACFSAELRRLHEAGRIGTVRKMARVAGKKIAVEVAPQEIVSDMVILVMVLGVIGARLFHILEHTGEFMADMLPWVRDGRIRYREDVVDGLEHAPAAFVGMLTGRNFGKTVVKVAD